MRLELLVVSEAAEERPLKELPVILQVHVLRTGERG